MGEAALELERRQARPGDAAVEAIVGLAAWAGAEIVARAGLKSDMPVFGCRDLRRMGFVAADKPSEEFAGRRRRVRLEQNMPHHRHAVTAQNEALNVFHVEGGLVRRLDAALDPFK